MQGWWTRSPQTILFPTKLLYTGANNNTMLALLVQARAQGPLVYTVDHGKWPFPMVQLLKKTTTYKAFGPSLSINRVWTARNDHAPKSKCVDFLKTFAQKGQCWIKKKSYHILSLSLRQKNQDHYKNIIIIFLCHGPCFLFRHSTSFVPPTAKPSKPCQWVM